MSKSSVFKSQLRPAAATASVLDASRETESKMEISMASDVTNQPSTTSLSHQPAAVATSTAVDPVLDQFQQVRSMISSFWGARQDPTTSLHTSCAAYSDSSTTTCYCDYQSIATTEASIFNSCG